MKGQRMDHLKKSFTDLFEQYKQGSRPLVFATWSDKLEKVMTEVHNKSKTEADTWINAIGPVGGTNLQGSLKEALQQFGEIEDCYIACDGIFTYPENEFTAMCQAHP